MYEYIDWMYSLFLAQLAGLDHNIRQLEVFRYSRSLPFTNNLTSITHARSVTKWHSPITTTTISVSHYNKNIHCISMVCVCLFWCIGWTSGSSILWKRNLSGVHIWISSLFFFLINALIQFIFDSSQLTTTTIEKTYVFWFLCVHSRTLRARFLLLHSLKCYINKKRFSSISRKQQARNEKSYMRERKENARGWSGVCARGEWDVRSERRWRQSARKIRTEQPTDKSPERRRRRVFVYAKRVSEREWAGVDRVSEIGLYWRWWSLLFASYLILLLLLFLVYCRASIQSKPAHVRRFNFGWFLFSFFFFASTSHRDSGPSFHFRSLFLNSMYAPLLYTRSMDRCTIQICNVYLDGFTRYWSMNCGAATNGKVLFVLCVCAPIGFLLLFWHSYMNSICFESACVPFVLFCFVCFRCSRLVFVYCLDVSLFWPFTLCQTANNKHKQINIQQCLDMQKI